jgi:phospholipase/lecithinase/hemolysin
VLVPFPYGSTLIATARAGFPATLDCSDDHNIEPEELANLHAAVATFNTIISARANTRGWAYFNPNVAFAALRADPNQVAVFPNPAATNCNGVGASGSPFGLAFSCDGIHPSTATHHLIAQTLVQVINAKYGSAIPPVP